LATDYGLTGVLMGYSQAHKSSVFISFITFLKIKVKWKLQIIHIILGKANPNRMNGVTKVVNSLAESQAQLGMECDCFGGLLKPVPRLSQSIIHTQLFKDTASFSIDPNLELRLSSLKDAECGFSAFTVDLFHNLIPIAKLFGKKQSWICFLQPSWGISTTVALERSKWKKKAYIPIVWIVL